MSEPNSGSDAFSLSTTGRQKGFQVHPQRDANLNHQLGPVADVLVVFAHSG